MIRHLRLISLLAIPLFTGTPPVFGQTAVPDGVTARAAGRFLDQATWGPNPAAVAEVQRLGLEGWLNAQFNMQTSDLPDQAVLNSDGKSNNNLTPVQAAFFANAVNEPDQLHQRIAFALSQIWVVSAVSGVAPAYAYPPYWRIFRDNAFGNYAALIKAVTLSPAMGRYLSMANNNKANAAKGTAANENYARELMQLFTLGLIQLKMNGTPLLDPDGNTIPTYTQTVVTNMAKVLTGWTYPTAPNATAKTNNPAYYIGPMIQVPAQHDVTAKTIFGGLTIQANQSAEQDLDSLVQALMEQPTMAPFISQQLIQHLVTSNPSPAYVERVANVFRNNGSGLAGDLRAVVTAILLDPEARAGDNPDAAENANYGHLREPILLMTNLLRGLNATVTANNTASRYAANLGENLFNAPSVFSYFSPQYRTSKGLLAPEFQIYSTQTAADRADSVNTILYGALDKFTPVDLSGFVNAAGNTTSLLNSIAVTFLHGSMSPPLTQAAESAINATSGAANKAKAALYVVLTSAEYQVIQ
jgi:uncharacterized protein (DUF1800 family)